jgi:hypothetical protein
MTALPVEEALDAVGHFIAKGGAVFLIVVAASIISTCVVGFVQAFRTFRAFCLLT